MPDFPFYLLFPCPKFRGHHPDHLGVSDPKLLGTVERCFADLLPVLVPRLEGLSCLPYVTLSLLCFAFLALLHGLPSPLPTYRAAILTTVK